MMGVANKAVLISIIVGRLDLQHFNHSDANHLGSMTLLATSPTACSVSKHLEHHRFGA